MACACAVILSIGTLAPVDYAAAQDGAEQLGEVQSTVPGDASCTGTATIIDALLIMLYTIDLRAGTTSCPVDYLTEINVANSDVDHDGQVTIIDALIVARCASGLDVERCAPPAVATIAANDLMVNAITLVPSEHGYVIDEAPERVDATIELDENDANCISDRFGPGSVWYKFEATTGRVSFLPTNDEQYIGIFRPADGVSSPTQMSDLELISCDESNHDVGAIVRPGETYWVSVSGSWRQKLWVFDRDPGCPAEFASCTRKRMSNDRISQAIGIDLRNDGEYIDVDDFNPGWSDEESANITWTYSADEVGVLGCNTPIPSQDFLGGSFWYEVVAPGNELEVRGSDDQYVAIYAPNEPHSPADRYGVRDMSDLTQISCGEPQGNQRAATIAGETYFVVSFEQYAGQVFSIGVPTEPAGVANDDISNALAIELPAAGETVLVNDQFDPSDENWSYSDDEAADTECFSATAGWDTPSGSVWYSLVATGDRIEVLGGDDQRVGIYAANSDHVAGLSDLTLLACGEPESRLLADTVPGETYYLASFEQYPGQQFTVGTPLAIPNDEIVTATTIAPSITGTRIEAFAPGYRATFADDETVDNCQRANRRQTGSAWYRFEATSGRVSTLGDDPPFRAAIYAAAPGVAEPTTMSDLVLITCDGRLQPSAIVQPGRTYWLSLNNIDTDIWLFEHDPPCVFDTTGNQRCPWRTNDDIRKPAGIDMTGSNPAVVDDFGPGTNLPGDMNIELTSGHGEDDPSRCIDNVNGSAWYSFTAPSASIVIDDIGDQTIAVYVPNYRQDFGVQTILDLDLVACSKPDDLVQAVTTPGQTYYLVTSGNVPGEVFSISW